MAGPTFTLASDAYSGRKLGKYEILSRLSTGGMSEIFLAFQRGLAGFRKFVVLKQILPDIKGEEEFVRMFLDEAKITAAFTHPNIAQVFDLDIADGELFLAMEFVPGATLVEVARACRARNEPIPIGFSLQAVRDTALALHYAHTFTDPMGKTTQVIHRDIAEKNIMVTYEGVTKLLDFGIAKSLNRAPRTTVGMVKGTSGYMSPEQIMGERIDPRSDLFSLGVVLHECLTGMRLFHGKTAEDGMLQALKCEVSPPSEQNRSVSSGLDAVTLKALQKEREDRYGSCLEFARDLERVAGSQIWHPEQSAAFVQRLFAQRRDQTHRLMMSAQGADHTGEFRLAEFLGNEARPSRPAPLLTAAPPISVPRESEREKTEIDPLQARRGYGDQLTAPGIKPRLEFRHAAEDRLESDPEVTTLDLSRNQLELAQEPEPAEISITDRTVPERRRPAQRPPDVDRTDRTATVQRPAGRERVLGIAVAILVAGLAAALITLVL